MARFQNEMGGTGVAPVKSGVAPDFIRRFIFSVVLASQSQFVPQTVSGATPETTGQRPVLPQSEI